MEADNLRGLGKDLHDMVLIRASKSGCAVVKARPRT
jgi:hypothetical protein